MIHRIVLFMISVFALCCAASGQAKSSANEIVEEMAKKFRSADTYRVSGVMRSVRNLNPYRKLTWEQALTRTKLVTNQTLSFSFYFERPSKLRFDWSSRDHHVDRNLSIWTNGTRGFSWLPSSGEADGHFVLMNLSDIKMLLQEADFNQSSSMASIFYAQLTGDKRAFTFNEMTEAKIVREDVIDGRNCFVILGNISNDPWALWIDKSTFVLRKVRLLISLTSFDETVATGKQSLTIGEVNLTAPQMNAQIPSSVFTYKPRLRKKDIDISK